MGLLPLLLLHQPTRGITMAVYECEVCGQFKDGDYEPGAEGKIGDVCPDCVTEFESSHPDHIEEMRLEALQPAPLNGLGEE